MKKSVKIIVDIAMIIMLPILMAYSLVSDVLHEYLGIAMFVLFIIHHIFNRKWLFSVFKGKYTLQRAFMTTINLLLFVIMFALPISGIMMSRYALPALSVSKWAFVLRQIHIFTAYWGFVLMSVHAGTHGKMMINKIPFKNGKATIIMRIIAALTVMYGGYAFFKRKILDYLFLKNQFAFFFDEDKAMYIFDYFIMIIMFSVIGYYIMEFLRFTESKKRYK